MNTTFCMAPWVNIGVNPNGDYTLCCVSLEFDESDLSVENPYGQQLEFFDSDKESDLYIGSVHDNTLKEI